MDNIKPVCCGCGGEAFTHILGNEIAKGYYIACDECETKTKVFGYEAEAIEAWNRAMSGNIQYVAVFGDMNAPKSKTVG